MRILYAREDVSFSDYRAPTFDLELSSDPGRRPVRTRVRTRVPQRGIVPCPCVENCTYRVKLQAVSSPYGIALQILMEIWGAFHQNRPRVAID
jgi:hypothetical protein